VAQTLIKHRGLFKHLHRTFEVLREKDRRQKHQPHGDDIDIDAISDAYTDLQRGLEASDRLFTRARKQERDIAVMFMVDISGSTAGLIP
jgi:nitric oxide reductase NorD protein